MLEKASELSLSPIERRKVRSATRKNAPSRLASQEKLQNVNDTEKLSSRTKAVSNFVDHRRFTPTPRRERDGILSMPPSNIRTAS